MHEMQTCYRCLRCLSVSLCVCMSHGQLGSTCSVCGVLWRLVVLSNFFLNLIVCTFKFVIVSFCAVKLFDLVIVSNPN